MSDRYTSPETSRALAEAGLEQGFDGMVVSRPEYAWWQDAPVTDGMSLVRALPSATRNPVRALNLTDALHEIEKAIPLSDWGIHTCDAGYACQVWVKKDGTGYSWSPIPDHEAASFNSPAEAAALVLLALLRERAK